MYIHRRSSPSEPSQVCPVLFESLEPRLLLTGIVIPGFTQMEPFGSMVYTYEVSGELVFPEGEDGYEFDGLAGESLSLGLVPKDPLLTVGLRILNMRTAALSLNGIPTPGDPSYENNFILLSDDPYAVIAARVEDYGDYDLTIVKNAFVVPDEFGGPANDSLGNALDLDDGFVDLFDPGNGAVRTAVYSNAAAVEVDYYSFTVAAGDIISLVANSTSGSNVQIVLSKGGTVLVTGNSGETSNISGYVAAEAGTYVVKVTPATDPGYSLTVLKNADIAAVDNSDIATAWEIDPTDVALGGVGGADMQYFRFYQNGGKTAITTSTPIGSLLDPKIELFNDAGDSIATDSNSDPDGKNAYIFEDLAAGWYKVGVGSDSGTGEYVLLLEKQIKVIDSSPYDTEWVTTAPTTAVMTFSGELDPATVAKEDLLIKGGDLDQAGVAATGVTVDGDTATFTLPAGLVKGSYTLEIAAGAVADDRGVEVEAFSSSFVYSDPITVDSSSPTDTQWVTTRPDSVVITFSADVDPTTVAIEDLVINSGDVVATGVSVSGNQVTFTLPTNLAKISYTLDIAAAAIADDRGVGNVAFSSGFEYTDPVTVISSSVALGATLPPGTLRFEFQFSRNLYEDVLGPEDVLLEGGSGSYEVLQENFIYDSATQTLNLKYIDVNVNFDAFTLSLLSGNDNFRALEGGNSQVDDRYALGFIAQNLAQGRPQVISFGSGAPAIYRDFNGNEVRIALSGPGAGEVNFETEFQGYPTLVKVVGTTSSSYLTITTAAGIETIIQNIEIAGPLAALTGRTTDIASRTEEPLAEITIDGKLGRLVLDDLLGDTKITINDSDSAVGAKYTTSITFDQVENGDMVIKQIPISTLTATSWEDGDILTPWIKTVRITGDVSRSIRGDFGGTLILTGSNNHPKWPYALENIYVSGLATGTIDATFGGIKLIEASQWDSGIIKARWVRKINIKGSVRDQLAGDFGARLHLTGFYLQRKTLYSIDNLIVAGQLFNDSGQSTVAGSVKQIRAGSTGESLDIDIVGNVKTFYAPFGIDGTIEAGAFGMISTKGNLSAAITVDSYDLKKSMSIKTLKAGWATDATIDALRGIGTIIVGQWDGGSIKAGFINKINVNGRGDNADGRFYTNLELTGVGATKDTLNNATIAGSIIGDDGDDGESNDKNWTWDITGNARTIIIKGDVSNWKLTSTGDVKTLKLGAVDSTEAVANPDDNDPDNDDNTFYTDIVADGDIYNLQISQWIEGRIEANAIHSMSTRRQRNVANSGQLANATIVLNGSYGRVATALGKLNVNGNITDTTIKADTGGVGTIKAWTWDGGELAASKVGRITTNKATNFTADLDIVGVVSYVTIAGDLFNSNWSARSFSNIMVKGHMEDTTLTANQMPHSSIKAIGILVVKNDVVRTRIKTAGHIKSIQVGAMVDSTVFAGPVTERDEWPIVPDYDEDGNLVENDLANDGDSVLDLPDPKAGDLYLDDDSLRANIYNFTITGRTIVDHLVYLANSNIAAAGDMGTVSIFDYWVAASGTRYGFAADRIGSFKITSGNEVWKNLEEFADSKLSFIDDLGVDGDFQIRLV